MSALSSKLITQTFRLHGLSITPDATQHLLEQAPAYKLPPAQFLSQLLSKIDKTSLKQSLIDKKELQKLLRVFKSTAPAAAGPAAAAAAKKAGAPFALEDILGSQYQEFVAGGDDETSQGVARRPAVAPSRPALVEESFKVISALAMPRLRYNTKRHKVERLGDEKGSLLGSAQSKIDMYKTWWYNAHLREGNGLVGAGAITTIESLAGRYSGQWRLMGILSEAEYGLYHVEDPTGRLLVDLTHATAKRPRLFTEGGLVLVEGKMKDDKLIVEYIDVPGAAVKENQPYIPPPLVCDSMSYEETITRAMGDGGDKGMVVVFSDIRVDNAIAMTRLDSVLRSFAEAIETHKPKEKILFVLIGDFFARNKNVHVFPRVIRTPPKPRTVYPFDPLADVLSRFPVLTDHARFVLVPGPSDPASLTASFALPRDPLPAIMLPPILGGGSASTRRSDDQPDEEEEEEDMESDDDDGGAEEDDDGEDGSGKRKRPKTKSVSGTVAEVIRGSNPCRVKYAGQDLLFYRGDMQDKFLRYALDVPLADDGSAEGREDVPRFEQAARTIADAGHLSPFPQAAQPVYWDHVQGLYMDPLPDLLVLADNASPFALTHASSLIINPGSFSTSPFVALYTPSTRACRLLVSS